MIQTILVPLDGSPFAEQALAPAIRLARRGGVTLLLLSAASEDALPAGPEYPLRMREREASAYLQLLQGRLRRAGITAQVEVSRLSAEQAILATAGLREVDLIAMATHGRSGPRQTLCGSVARRVITDAQLPLLLVRSGAGAPTFPDGSGFQRLLVPLDGTREAERSLQYMEAEALTSQAALTLLRVVPYRLPGALSGLGGYSAPVGHDQAEIATQHGQMEAYRYLDAAIRNTLAGASCRTRVVVGYPAKVILDMAVADEADLIVLSSQGSESARPQPGSVAWHVLNNAQVPVLLLRPAPAPATAAKEGSAKNAAMIGSENGQVAVLVRGGDDD